MSHKTYDEEFRSVHDLLTTTLQTEPVQADRRDERLLLATLYIRYILIANKLIVCVDQMVQPQKRILIRKLLEATLGRILELKSDLVEADLNEWTHCGDVIEKLNLTPLDMELTVPSCFRKERKSELEYRKHVIDSVLAKLGYIDKTLRKVPMTEQQAILIIQSHERARQGRLRAQFMKEIKTMKEKSKPVQAEESEEAKESKLALNLSAAVKIQKIWRGYAARRATRRRKLQEMLLIGMIPPPKTKSEEIERDLENRRLREKLQDKRLVEYERAVTDCRERLEKTQRGTVLEQLSDQIRSWLHEYKTQTGKIPEYTGSERSASRLMLSRQGTDSELSKSTQGSSKESKTKKEKSAKSVKDSKSNEEEEDLASKAIVSTFVPELNLRKEEYNEVWKNKDESDNPQQFPDKHLIEQDQMADMETELRKVVDEMMVTELELLQEAFDKDRGHKTKRKSSKKARRAGKKSKKKKEKDLTPDRTTESLFEELVANGIIKRHHVVIGRRLKIVLTEKHFHNTIRILFEVTTEYPNKRGYLRNDASWDIGKNIHNKSGPEKSMEFIFRCPETYLSDFKGERSYFPPAVYNVGKDPPVALGDIRQVVHEYCILPLLTPHLHQSTPHIKSVLLAGPKGSGKDMLVQAVCTEVGAMLFDLTPANIVGKYPGKSGLIMLIHLVVKVSRLLQPAVIYMDCAERPFVKKIPKTDKSDPKRLKKDLPKMVKNFAPEDRVILIGVSNCPWDSDQKLLQQVYQKFLFIPRPNYSSRFSIWSHLLGQYMAVGWQFDTGVMTKISDGYSVGSIISTVNEVMTVKRMLQLRIHPLSPLELVNVLCKRTPIYKEEEEALEQWWSKVPLVKRRARAVEMLLEEQAEIQAKQADAKTKKK